MKLIPEGPFTMGSDDGNTQAQPEHPVTLSAYCLDETEVTNRQWASCVEVDGCAEPTIKRSTTHDPYYDDPGFLDFPRLNVIWGDAQNYCEKARGGDLPTEAQWEKAARGEHGGPYPWGDESPDCGRANFTFLVDGGGLDCCVCDADDVGTRSKGNSPYGVQDMAGNVTEWVHDYYSVGYDECPSGGCVDPKGPEEGGNRVMRGGSYADQDEYIRTFYRREGLPTTHYPTVGFRCAAAPTPGPDAGLPPDGGRAGVDGTSFYACDCRIQPRAAWPRGSLLLLSAAALHLRARRRRARTCPSPSTHDH